MCKVTQFVGGLYRYFYLHSIAADKEAVPLGAGGSAGPQQQCVVQRAYKCSVKS